jgi:Mg2+ and Co2+ transporter CorA
MIVILGYDSSSVASLEMAQVGDYLRQPGAALWLDLTAPVERDFIQLRQLFQFQRRHLEACQQAVRPPLAATPRYLFAPMTAADGQPWFVFLGKSFLVTVHAEPIEAIAAQYSRYALEANLWSHGVDQLFLSLAEESVYPFADQLTAVTANNQPLFSQQEQLLHLERQVTIQTAVLRQISQLQHEYLDANIAHFTGQLADWLASVGAEATFQGHLLTQQIAARRYKLAEQNLAAAKQLGWVTAALFIVVLIIAFAAIIQLFL